MEWFLGILAIAVVIVLAVRLLRDLFFRGEFSVRSHRMRRTGDSVWSYRSGRWSMTEDRSAAGFVPGPAPAAAGEYEGQSVRVVSVPRPRGPA